MEWHPLRLQDSDFAWTWIESITLLFPLVISFLKYVPALLSHRSSFCPMHQVNEVTAVRKAKSQTYLHSFWENPLFGMYERWYMINRMHSAWFERCQALMAVLLKQCISDPILFALVLIPMGKLIHNINIIFDMSNLNDHNFGFVCVSVYNFWGCCLYWCWRSWCWSWCYWAKHTLLLA